MKQNFRLEDLPKHNIYQVPDNYFEKLPGKIMARVIPENAPTGTSWLEKFLYTYKAAFASLLLLISFVGAFYISEKKQPVTSASFLPLVSTNDVMEYVSNSNVMVEPGDLADLNLTDTDISHEFYNISSEEILEKVDEQQLEEAYFN